MSLTNLALPCIRHALATALAAAALAQGAIARAAPSEPGRLFYTPAQRAQLEAARSRGSTRPATTSVQAAEDSPQRYDGLIIRSDGQVTHWVDGKPAATAPRRLQPGQTRAGSRVYESYQLLPPAAQPVPTENAAP